MTLVDLVRSDQFSFLDAKVVIGSVHVGGLLGYTIDATSDLTPIHVMGLKNPVALQEGKKEYKGSVTMLASTYYTILKAARTGDEFVEGLADVGYVDILIILASKSGLRVAAIKCIDCKLQEPKRGLKLDDPKEEIEVPFQCLAVVENIF